MRAPQTSVSLRAGARLGVVACAVLILGLAPGEASAEPEQKQRVKKTHAGKSLKPHAGKYSPPVDHGGHSGAAHPLHQHPKHGATPRHIHKPKKRHHYYKPRKTYYYPPAYCGPYYGGWPVGYVAQTSGAQTGAGSMYPPTTGAAQGQAGQQSRGAATRRARNNRRTIYAPMPDLTYPAYFNSWGRGWGWRGYNRGWNPGYGYGEFYRRGRGFRRYPWSYGYIGWPVYTYGPYPAVDPRLSQSYDPNAAAPPSPPEPVDPAKEALRIGDYEEAVSLLGALAESDPEDETSRRLLVVALVGAGSLDIAAEALLGIHQENPSVASHPLDGPSLVKADTEFRRLLTLAVSRAHRAKTPEAWLLVASMMQAEGRTRVALRQLDRAEQLGLADEVLGPMRDALEGRVP